MAQSAAADRTAEESLFDRATSLETLLPQVSDRALYEAKQPVTEGVHRSYAFTLKPQAGMDPARHFQIVTVTWTPANAAVELRGIRPATTNTGGPNGSFVERIAQTMDHRYDLRVTLGELLPNTAKSAAVDVAQMADRLVDRYTELTSRKR